MKGPRHGTNRILCSLLFVLACGASSVGIAIETKGIRVQGCLAALKLLDSRVELSAKNVNRSPVQTLTVEKKKTSRGKHGGSLITMERIASFWGSSYYKDSRFAPQGEPRGFIAVVGNDVADYFGFKQIGDDRLVAPNVKEFSGAIRDLNALLKKAKSKFRVNLDFKKQKKSKYPLTTYLDDYIDGYLPFAGEWSHLVHDLSQHTASIFYPEEVLDQSRYVTKVVRSLTKELYQKFPPDSPNGRAALILRRALHYMRARQIDEGTGTFVATLNYVLSNNEPKWFATPMALMYGQFGHKPGITNRWDSFTAKSSMAALLDEAIKPADPATMMNPPITWEERALLTRFLASPEFKDFFAGWEAKQDKRLYNKAPSKTFEQMCALISQRRLEVIRVVQEALK